MFIGFDLNAAVDTPADVMREGRIQDHARRLMHSLAANPKALEWSETTVAYTAFKLAEAFDELSQTRLSQSRSEAQ